MKIVVIGSGAMGSLYGGYLSQKNEVYLIDTDSEKVEAINKNGIMIKEREGDNTFYPKALSDSSGIGTADLIILFVKALFSKAALKNNKSLIGENTYVLTLQNGSGHEEILREFVSEDHIIIGTTQHNASIIGTGQISHGGSGKTTIGMIGKENKQLFPIKESFESCGFDTAISDNIQKIIWDKLFTNVSASVMTGVLQVKLGYLIDNEHGFFLVKRLVKEAVEVANGDGMNFDEPEVLEKVKEVLINAHEGYTSIYADIRDKRKTEVDTISGYVVSASKRNGVPAPTHEFVVELVHALEEKE
ncbi:ketopantoate reductase family protein [Anaerobium acetethylicum]|uniref:2-dehydropantoate 2-reductase n=1 Tax=Anaerobium acetethylicum TaxID=1619234 RepID=A0A1D3TYD2_9FIRM|nr:ketopantoate reductase family protein [Anaerobium acetethylicum]SCP99443.1 2-dehydropantoate 2-reductase [Anaerobium acetethylicum]